MARNEAQRTREGEEHKTWFERFVEAIHARVSEAPFFFVCAGIVVAWLVSAPWWPNLKSWQVAIHTVSSVLSLLLLVLLENSGRRSEEAAQEKLNVVAEALAALMDSRGLEDPELREATQKLRDSVGLEARH